MTPPKKEPIETVKVLLGHAREELNRADNKASITLASAGIGFGAFLGGAVSGDWQPFDLGNCVEWVWWVGALLFVVGVCAIASSVWPSTETKTDDKIPSYYQRVAKLPDTTALRSAMESVDLDEILIEQLLVISKIVRKKYLKLRIGLGLLVVGTAFLTAPHLLQNAC